MKSSLLSGCLVLQSVSVVASVATASGVPEIVFGSEACSSWGSESCSSSAHAVGLLQVRADDVAAKGGSARYVADADAHLNQSIVFIRTHHTGSTTVTGIFQRFCDEHNVTCAPNPPHKFIGGTANHEKLAKYVTQHAGKDKIDIWPWHVYYLREPFEKLMPGALTLSIFREPEARVVSCLSHDGWSTEEVREAVNQLQTNGEMPQCGDRQRWHVQDLADVDLVLLMEDYDRSLVLMAKKLGWSLEKVLYLQLRVSEVSDEKQSALNDLKAYIEQPLHNMTETGKEFVTDCIEKDKPLYNEAKARFQQQLSSLTPKEHAEIKKDVHRLQSAVKILQECCNNRSGDPYCVEMAENDEQWHMRHARGDPLPDGFAEAHCRRVAVNELES